MYESSDLGKTLIKCSTMQLPWMNITYIHTCT